MQAPAVVSVGFTDSLSNWSFGYRILNSLVLSSLAGPNGSDIFEVYLLMELTIVKRAKDGKYILSKLELILKRYKH